MTTEREIEGNGEAKFWARTLSAILASVDSILGKLGALFPWLRDWLDRPIIVPGQQRNWWHMRRTGDGRPSMQIVTYWYVTNRTDRPVTILNAYIRKSQWQGIVSTRDTRSDYYGSYPVPPHATTDLHVDFDGNPPFRREGKPIKVDIAFIDQSGQKRTVKNVRIDSDKRKLRSPVKLQQEAIYKLEHDIEKKVAAVLKDEISRYKKFGRLHGELGSLHVVHNGRIVKRIYQDGWTDSRSGERLEIIADPDNAVVQSDNGDALVAYFNALEDEAERELFINSLLTRLNRAKEYYCVSYLILYVLYRIGELESGLQTAEKSLVPQPNLIDRFLRRQPRSPLLEQHQRHGLGDMLGLLNGLLRYAHPSFSDQELDVIEAFIEGPKEFGDRIAEKIHSARSFRLGPKNLR
jgi:hypothetical protein